MGSSESRGQRDLAEDSACFYFDNLRLPKDEAHLYWTPDHSPSCPSTHGDSIPHKLFIYPAPPDSGMGSPSASGIASQVHAIGVSAQVDILSPGSNQPASVVKIIHTKNVTDGPCKVPVVNIHILNGNQRYVLCCVSDAAPGSPHSRDQEPLPLVRLLPTQQGVSADHGAVSFDFILRVPTNGKAALLSRAAGHVTSDPSQHIPADISIESLRYTGCLLSLRSEKKTAQQARTFELQSCRVENPIWRPKYANRCTFTVSSTQCEVARLATQISMTQPAHGDAVHITLNNDMRTGAEEALGRSGGLAGLQRLTSLEWCDLRNRQSNQTVVTFFVRRYGEAIAFEADVDTSVGIIFWLALYKDASGVPVVGLKGIDCREKGPEGDPLRRLLWPHGERSCQWLIGSVLEPSKNASPSSPLIRVSSTRIVLTNIETELSLGQGGSAIIANKGYTSLAVGVPNKENPLRCTRYGNAVAVCSIQFQGVSRPAKTMAAPFLPIDNTGMPTPMYLRLQNKRSPADGLTILATPAWGAQGQYWLQDFVEKTDRATMKCLSCLDLRGWSEEGRSGRTVLGEYSVRAFHDAVAPRQDADSYNNDRFDGNNHRGGNRGAGGPKHVLSQRWRLLPLPPWFKQGKQLFILELAETPGLYVTEQGLDPNRRTKVELLGLDNDLFSRPQIFECISGNAGSVNPSNSHSGSPKTNSSQGSMGSPSGSSHPTSAASSAHASHTPSHATSAQSSAHVSRQNTHSHSSRV